MTHHNRPESNMNHHSGRKNSLTVALCLLMAASAGLFSGCAAFHPINGVPVEGIPMEFRAEPRSDKIPLDLSRLRQAPPPEYRVAGGDLLGIFVEGVLGKPDDLPPVTISNHAESRPALGYPILVHDNGTISLPGLPDLLVEGMTLHEIRERLRYAYTVENPIMQKSDGQGEDALIVVDLQRKRTYRVMVIRQEAESSNSGSGAPSQIDLSIVRRGTGQVVELPAYENDVLHALTQTGGLPSSQAENAVYILRRRPRYVPSAPVGTPRPAIVPQYQPGVPFAPPSAPSFQPPAPSISQAGHSTGTSYRSQPAITFPRPVKAHPTPIRNGSPYGSYRGHAAEPKSPHRPGYTVRGQSPEGMPSSAMMPGAMFWDEASPASPEIIRIPLRVNPGEHLPFTEADIILDDGDIVFVESRETEFFFTGGLLGGGQYVLPQNYDLDLLGALSIVQSQVNTSFNSNTKAIGGVSALNHDVTVGASKVIVLRKAPNGCEIKIEVDLYDAIRDPSQRILIQPGDYVLLQYTRMEAVAAFFERHILEGAVVGGASSLVFGGN